MDLKTSFLFFLLSLPLFLWAQGEVSVYGSRIYMVGDEVYVQAASGLNMRAEPKSSAPKVGVIPFKEKAIVKAFSSELLKVTDYEGLIIEDNWYQVSYKGKEGYVFGGYLSRFPMPSDIERDYFDIGYYLDEVFTVKDTIILAAVTYKKGSKPFPCHFMNIYDVGITETFDNCSDECTTIRYVWEDTRLNEIVAIFKYQADNQEVEYEVSVDNGKRTYTLEIEFCRIQMSELSAGGVLVEVFCCS